MLLTTVNNFTRGICKCFSKKVTAIIIIIIVEKIWMNFNLLFDYFILLRGIFFNALKG